MERDAGPHPATVTGGRRLATVNWILLGITLTLSCTGLLGFGIWILPLPIAVATLVMGIILRTRGNTQGISLIIAAILIVPLSFAAQFVLLAALGASSMQEERWQETRMLENLEVIRNAKEGWVAATQARSGMPVTMANLTNYLNGQEVKPIMGEQYDPRPVGQAPTATLPEGKHLWSYPISGATYTGGALVKLLMTSSSNPINLATGEFLHPSGRWFPTLWKAPPPPSAAPSPTPAKSPETSEE
jgi:hypothetical protein